MWLQIDDGSPKFFGSCTHLLCPKYSLGGTDEGCRQMVIGLKNVLLTAKYRQGMYAMRVLPTTTYMYILHRTYYNMQNQYINRYKGNSLLVMVHKCTRYSVYHSLICNIENKFFSMPCSFVSIQILLVAYNHVLYLSHVSFICW